MSSFASGWQPTATRRRLQARARLLAAIRAFFAERSVLEVETPLACRYATTDPALDSLSTRFTGPGHAQGLELFLQTSPEFAMKRLLAAGSGDIYQITRAFRDGECGRRHQPEFSLLEWYRLDLTLETFMEEVLELVQSLAGRSLRTQRLSYRQLFQEVAGLDPWKEDPVRLREGCQALGLEGLTWNAFLDGVLTHWIEPQLPADTLTLVYHYPPAQGALACIRRDLDPPVAERFELYWGALELANGFHELGEAEEQRQRFLADLEVRRFQGRAQPALDERLLAALEAGLPDCCGVAVGLDRLLMAIEQVEHIAEVLAFPLERA